MSTLTLRAGVCSRTGRRTINEDAAYASPRLLAVADGVGGAASGEVASRLVIDKLIGLDKRRLTDSLEHELTATIADANAVIAFVTVYDPRHTGMATTLTSVALADDGAYLVANVGDSRTYLLRDGRLTRLTRDDSFVQHLIDRGLLTEDEARVHPRRSLVLEALDGVERAPTVPEVVRAQPGDRLLLCSDGVSDVLDDESIAGRLAGADPRTASRALVDAALAAGSRDNVTAVVADVRGDGDPATGWLPARP